MSTKKGTSSKKQKVKQKTAAQVVGSRAAGMKSAARRSPKGGSDKKKKAKAKGTSGKPSKTSRTMKSAATEPNPAKFAGAALKRSAARRRSSTSPRKAKTSKKHTTASSKQAKKGKGTASKGGKAAESDSKEAEASDETPYNGKYIEKAEDKEDEKYGHEERCEGRDELFFPTMRAMKAFTASAIAKKFENKAFGNNERELDEFLLEYVYSETDCRYDPHLPIFEFYRRLWWYLRNTPRVSLGDCFRILQRTLEDQHMYRQRLKHLGKQPSEDWSQTKAVVDALVSDFKLMPQVFMSFPSERLSLGSGLYKVLRYIIFTSDNGYSMWCKSPSGELLSAHDYAIRTGAVTLQCLMAEFMTTRLAPCAALSDVIKRDIEDGLCADDILAQMETEGDKLRAVQRVKNLWNKVKLVDNISFKVAQLIEPKIDRVLLKLANEGLIDSAFLLKQLHTSMFSIIDWDLFKGALKVIEKNQSEAARTLRTALEKLLNDSKDEQKAFAALCAVQNEQMREAHAVHMWDGTDASESAKPMMSEATVESAAAEMLCDSGLRIKLDHGVYGSKKQAHSHYLFPLFLEVITKLFQAKTELCLATLSFAEPKSAERSKQKAAEYLKQLRRYPSFACILDLLRFSATCESYDELLKVFHAFVQLFVDGIIVDAETGVRIVLVRIKNTFDAGKLGRFGDIKINMGISVPMPDGSYYTTTCECSFNLTQAQVCHKRLHVEYELMRQRDFYEAVFTSKVSAQTILSSAEIDAMFPRVDFLNTFFGGSEALPHNCRHFLQLAGFSLKHAKQLVGLLTGDNPLQGDGVAVCNLVLNHSKDLGEWLELLKDPKLFGAEDESWKKLTNTMKETPLVVYFSTGECEMAVIRELNVSKSTFRQNELCASDDVSVVHYLAMHATHERIAEFNEVFPSVLGLFLSAKCFMGPPLAAYLNAAGPNATVDLARAFLPVDRSADVFEQLLSYVDVTDKALEVIRALFTPVQFNNMKASATFDGFTPVLLYVTRATSDCEDAHFSKMVRTLVEPNVFRCHGSPQCYKRAVADVFSSEELEGPDFLFYRTWKMHFSS